MVSEFYWLNKNQRVVYFILDPILCNCLILPLELLKLQMLLEIVQMSLFKRDYIFELQSSLRCFSNILRNFHILFDLKLLANFLSLKVKLKEISKIFFGQIYHPWAIPLYSSFRELSSDIWFKVIKHQKSPRLSIEVAKEI